MDSIGARYEWVTLLRSSDRFIELLEQTLNQKIDSSLELDLVANWGPKGHLKGKISHVDHWFILSGESRSFEQIVRDIADRVWKFSCHDISSTSSKGPHLDGHYLKGFFYLTGK